MKSRQIVDTRFDAVTMAPCVPTRSLFGLRIGIRRVHPVANVFNEHGRFLFQHRPKKVSASAVDIYVHDSLGKLVVILHHTDIDGTELCTIEEEWMK